MTAEPGRPGAVGGVCLELFVADGELSVCRLPATAPVPEIEGASFVSVTRTAGELSLVVERGAEPAGAIVEPGWRCIGVRGPLAFELTGVLANLSGCLATAGISLFAISTYETDYLLVKAERLQAAREALERAGHQFA